MGASQRPLTAGTGESMAEKETFSNKFRALFKGKRPFPKRLLLALGPSLAISFTLLFFGPLDLSCISRDHITYSALEILPAAALVMGVVFLVLLLAASISGGKVHAFLVSVYSGLGIAFYLQGAFLNPGKIGVLLSQGFETIEVYKKPSVGILSSGNEITLQGEELEYGKIYDVNGGMIKNDAIS